MTSEAAKDSPWSAVTRHRFGPWSMVHAAATLVRIHGIEAL